uniref:E3 ubiquitin-protein ligase TRIM39-like n=1 Tax=Scleropages formosus TaxID=113540 RepID=A0A8C9RHT9_SCLFO
MAATSVSLDEEFICSVCCEIFKDPVVLRCSHSFCRSCVQQYWEQKNSRECPVCRRRSSIENPPPNLVLKNIVETYLKKRSEEPICLVCHLSKNHRNHQCHTELEPTTKYEEEARLAALREEEEQKSQKMKEKIKNISKHVSILSDRIRDIEEHLNNEDTKFLVRFSKYAMVLGSEGFTSGKHSWEVEVGNKPKWDVGVVKESISRKGEITYSPKNGLWVLLLRNGDKYRAAGVTDLTLKKKPQRIRVQLDYDRGKVSFFNPTDMSRIYTFTDTFTEKLFPYFYPSSHDDVCVRFTCSPHLYVFPPTLQ